MFHHLKALFNGTILKQYKQIKEMAHSKFQDIVTSFFETHSIADYWGDLKESDDTFKRPTLTPVTIRFDPLVLKKIKILAKKRGLSYNAYTRYLLAKSVELELIHKPSP